MLMVIILMVATLLIGLVIHLTLQESLEGGQGGISRAAAYDILSDIDQRLLIRVFAVLFVTVVVAIMAGVFFLHRVAGPIYRLRVTLKQLADSQIPERNVQLRHGDFFQEVAVELNRVLEKARREHPDQILRRPPEPSAPSA